MRAIASDVLASRPRRWPALARTAGRALSAAWKIAAGLALTLHPLGAILVAGWTARLMQRTAFKAWWNGTPRPFRKLMTFREAAQHTPGWTPLAGWPRWVLGPPGMAQGSFGNRVWHGVRGLWENARRGAVFLACSASVLLLPCALFALAWRHGGWTEKADLLPRAAEYGLHFALAAGAPFVIAMFYLPMAQARLAVTDEWRLFFGFRFIRRVIRRRWLACTLLAVSYAAAGLVPMAFAVAARQQPEAFQSLPWPATLPVMFPLYVGLHVAAARIYASAVRHMLSTGEARAEDLSPAERLAFPPEITSPLADMQGWSRRAAWMSWTLSLPFRIVCGLAVTAAWLLAAMEAFVSQAHHPESWPAWFAIPLAHFPWAHF